MTIRKIIAKFLFLLLLIGLQWLGGSMLVLPDGTHLFLYVLFFMVLPPLPVFSTYLLFFGVGVLMDILMGNSGVNAIASTLIVPARIWLLSRNVSLHDGQIKKASPVVSMRKLQYVFYVAQLSFLFNLGWYITEQSPYFDHTGYMILRIIEGTILTFAICMLYSKIFSPQKKRR